MSHANITGVRDATIILTDYTNYTPWLLQLKGKAEFHDVWAIADPDGTRTLAGTDSPSPTTIS